MSDYFEIDFLEVGESKSGDAITIRYKIGEHTTIHVVDGGFQETGDSIVEHINKYYGNPSYIDRVVVTHPDGDHVGGLKTVLEKFSIGELWMLRPWNYAGELIYRFDRYTSVENLKKRLKEIYPNIATLEEIANKKQINIYEPFQGAVIGEFKVLAPTKSRYLDLIVESEKTPESSEEKNVLSSLAFGEITKKAMKKVINFIRAKWGEENFSDEPTSAENEMSVIQFSLLCNHKILLTGDAGRLALTEALNYAPRIGLTLPGIDKFQVPHHGSRRNLSSDILDAWLGQKLSSKPPNGTEKFSAIISVAKKDEEHPRKAVVRALIHRGAKVIDTKKGTLCAYFNSPDRGWDTAVPLEYPEDQEE
uniref:MBL fold metallo-hydrolase n=1 Tax=Ignavibacterium album TaxID=591197 RepID=A0A832DK10_9BACT